MSFSFQWAKEIFHGDEGGDVLSCFQEERGEVSAYPSCTCCIKGVALLLKFFKVSVCMYLYVLLAQFCLTLCDAMNCSLPGFFVHEILQARILEWIAIPISRESSKPRDWTWVSCVAGRLFTIWVTWEAPKYLLLKTILLFPLNLSPLPGVCFL